MKQRTRQMLNGDELLGHNVNMNRSIDSYNSEIQLHRIKPQDHFIEAQVQEGDTLQAIALRFYCSISELKRINHIHKDNEIFAKRTIKVPVTPYSVLTELIPAGEESQPVPSTSKQLLPNLNLPNILQHTSVNGLTSEILKDVPKTDSKENDCAIDCNAVILNSTLTPSVIPYMDSEQNDAISEDTQLLPNNKPKISVEAVVVKELTSHGADFGLKWFHLVGCMLILGVVIPLVYVMFYLDKHTDTSLHPT
ncbi:lysM and putative peptidoglycan-binding domain-containing protein 3 isoform X1 [Papilio machaon]|uniref:lysM and putative peptidoglycan-binding domain-containing protein 3 isoform X1 n=2 Tax=Papilio machaon TaxID=76193 RepID=UPI001E663C94|nr:lysM and putative peptidoglycan-binding domain-containing protein 3 isoform X1 [Papilio machaon]